MRQMPSASADVRWLSFRLRNGQGIGPAQLKAGWQHAARTSCCEVKRETVEGGEVVYALYAPGDLAAPREVELRMRQFLMDAGYIFTMGSLGVRSAH